MAKLYGLWSVEKGGWFYTKWVVFWTEHYPVALATVVFWTEHYPVALATLASLPEWAGKYEIRRLDEWAEAESD
jgi:hypothetical protein